MQPGSLIALVDYGVGNLQSLARAFAAAGAAVCVASVPEDLQRADGIVLPGVGHFQEAMDHLRQGGLLPALEQRVLAEGMPLLGVCLGMQLLMRGSEEGGYAGLGWLDGEVASLRRLHPDSRLKIPHIGWNNVRAATDSVLFHEVPPASCFYFAHSYAVVDAPPQMHPSHTDYGVTFVAAVEKGNLFGTQFHPEKSHQNGLLILKNFLAHVATRGRHAI